MGALTSRPYSFTQRPWELYSLLANPIFSEIGFFRVDFDKGRPRRVLPTRIYSLPWVSDVLRLFVKEIVENVFLRKIFTSNIESETISFYSNSVFPTFIYNINVIRNSCKLSYLNLNLRYLFLLTFCKLDVFLFLRSGKIFFFSEKARLFFFPFFMYYPFRIVLRFFACRFF